MPCRIRFFPAICGAPRCTRCPSRRPICASTSSSTLLCTCSFAPPGSCRPGCFPRAPLFYWRLLPQFGPILLYGRNCPGLHRSTVEIIVYFRPGALSLCISILYLGRVPSTSSGRLASVCRGIRFARCPSWTCTGTFGKVYLPPVD